MSSPRSALFFNPQFPDEALAGHCKEMVPSDSKRAWTLGRGEMADFVISDQLVSRLHCTIRWDDNLKQWALLDGGVYQDGHYSPSRNGVWLNKKRLRPKDWELICSSDKLCLGTPLGKIIFGQSCHDTINSEAWGQPGWPAFVMAQQGYLDSQLREELQAEARKNASPWIVAWDFGNWIQKTPRNGREAAYKGLVIISLIILGAILAVILGTI
ncbi:MAG: FHA domain-containing protein [Cyanobacteria bacterium P01_A01_bin.123]